MLNIGQTTRLSLRFLIGTFVIILFSAQKVRAQNCTVNAGIDIVVCDDATGTLMGVAAGIYNPASILWAQVSGPATTITSPSNLTSTITGLIPGNVYQFSLTITCGAGGSVTDIVEVDVVSPPAFTAGADVAFCNTTPPNLTATLPAGYTGVWASTSNDMSFDNPTSPTTSITLVDDCFKISTLTWTITNGNCVFTDEILYSGSPDPAQAYLFSNIQSFCGTSESAGVSCSPSQYDITVTPVSEPTPATISLSDNGFGYVVVDNMTLPGVYTYDVNIASSVCPGSTNTTIVFTALNPTGINASWNTNVTSILQSVYSTTYIGSAYQAITRHCVSDFAADYDTIWLNGLYAAPAGGTNTWSVPSFYTLDNLNADSTFAVYNGGVIANGSHWIQRNVNVGGCSATRFHRLDLYPEPPPVNAPDTVICSSSVMRIGKAEGLSPVHAAGPQSNGTYPTYVSSLYINQISGPTVAIDYVSASNANLLDDFYEFQGLVPGNVYTFVFGFPDSYSNWGNNTTSIGYFPYLNCYSGALRDTFSIVYPGPIGLSTGTSQVLACDSTNSQLAGALGVNQTGTWTFGSGPSIPNISTPNSSATDITNMNSIGSYIYNWTVTNECDTRIDSVLVVVPDCILLGVDFVEMEITCDAIPRLTWSTSSEQDNSHFTIFRSFDGASFDELATIPGAGNSTSTEYYSFNDDSHQDFNANGPTYYYISQTDYDGEETYLGARSTICDMDAPYVYFDPQGQLLISYGKAFEYSVYGSNGQIIHRGTSENVFDSKYYSSGIYMILITASDGTIFTNKKLCIKD